MLQKEIQDFLTREPFIPLRLHLVNGKTFDIPFPEVARMLSYAVLVFIGMKHGTREAKGYDRFAFEQITRIEERKTGKGRPRRKAS